MEHFLQGNVPLRHLLNEETLFMSRLKFAIKEVNDWAPYMYVGGNSLGQFLELKLWFCTMCASKSLVVCLSSFFCATLTLAFVSEVI